MRECELGEPYFGYHRARGEMITPGLPAGAGHFQAARGCVAICGGVLRGVVSACSLENRERTLGHHPAFNFQNQAASRLNLASSRLKGFSTRDCREIYAGTKIGEEDGRRQRRPRQGAQSGGKTIRYQAESEKSPAVTRPSPCRDDQGRFDEPDVNK
jgi:hypothetical protein